MAQPSATLASVRSHHAGDIGGAASVGSHHADDIVSSLSSYNVGVQNTEVMQLIQGVKEDSDNNFEFNKEQIECSAWQIWPLEQAWRMQLEGIQRPCTTVHTLSKLPDDLGLHRILIIGGGGCPLAPSNRAARGFHPDAKTIHSIASIRPQDPMRTDSQAHGRQPNACRRLGA